MRKATFPRMGPYTEAFKYLASQLGFEPIVPNRIDQNTIKEGVRNSSDMVCFPFKATFGSLLEGLKAGADTILVPGVPLNNETATCRFLFYYHIQEQLLKRLGYTFDIFYLRGPGWKILKSLRSVASGLSYWGAWKIVKNTYNKILEIEDRFFKFKRRSINIGIVGEAYTLWEPDVNYDIINKLEKMDVGVDVSIKLSWFLKHQIGRADEKEYLHEEVKKYFPKKIGGHGYESIYNTLWYAHNNFDGVIHLLPLSCMPETLVEMVVDMIGSDFRIPVYRFPIDENKFEAGFDTRLETFIKLLRRGKRELLHGDRLR